MADTGALTTSSRTMPQKIPYAEYQALYQALSDTDRARLKAEFRIQRVGNSYINWGRFLAVALPLLPTDD